MNEDDEVKPIYFGNDDQQTTVIETLEEAIKAGKSQMHLVSGGPSSGKSNTMVVVNAELEGAGKFDHLVTPEQIAEDDFPNEVPLKLRQLIRDMDFDNGIYVQHHIYKAYEPNASGKDVFVVVADGETPLTDRNALEMLDKAAELTGDPKKGYELVWIADVPIRLQSIPIFSPHSGAKMELEKHNAELKEFQGRHRKLIKTHTLKYDLPTIRESLWEAITEGGEDFIKAFAQTTHRATDEANKLEWEKACKAALEGDEKAYKSAFRTLAARAKVDKTVAG